MTDWSASASLPSGWSKGGPAGGPAGAPVGGPVGAPVGGPVGGPAGGPAGDGIHEAVDGSVDGSVGGSVDVLRWQQEYAAWEPVHSRSAGAIVRQARRHRRQVRAKRTGSVAATVAALTAGSFWLDAHTPPPPTPPVFVPAASPSWTTRGCVVRASSCEPVLRAWLTDHGLTGPITVVDPSVNRRETYPNTHAAGTILLEARLDQGSEEVPLDVIVIIATTDLYVPGVGRAPLDDSTRLTLRDGTAAYVWPRPRHPSWQDAITVDSPLAPGRHPSVQARIGHGDLRGQENPAATTELPPFPPGVTEAAVLELVERLLAAPQ